MKVESEKIIKQYEELTAKLASTTDAGELKILGKKQAAIQPLYEKITKLKELEKERKNNQELAHVSAESEIAELAKKELLELDEKIKILASEIDEELLLKDPLDEKAAILEIRAAAGGDESALFAAELFRMYSRYAEHMGWKTHLISQSRNELGGFKEIIFETTGRGVFGNLKFESGVHRVQRVPETEKSGRVHTSTVTVAVLPILEENEFKIDPKDLKIETSTSRGAGGQSVNTTYSAIKITHLLTGITASSQDERSQLQNRAKALQVLSARVFAYYEEKKRRELTEKRKTQIGTGDRSEKIRTYNFPQDRITDHRINQNFSQINLVMEGKLEPIISALQKADRELKKKV